MLYRAGIESILGLRVNGEFLLIDPCIPTAWPGFEMTLRYRGAVYEISVRNPGKVSRGVVAAELDGASQAVSKGKVRLKLSEDRGTHAIVVTLGLVSLSSVTGAGLLALGSRTLGRVGAGRSER